MNKPLVLVTLPFCIVGCYIMLNLCWDYLKQGEWTIFIIYFLWCVWIVLGIIVQIVIIFNIKI